MDLNTVRIQEEKEKHAWSTTKCIIIQTPVSPCTFQMFYFGQGHSQSGTAARHLFPNNYAGFELVIYRGTVIKNDTTVVILLFLNKLVSHFHISPKVISLNIQIERGTMSTVTQKSFGMQRQQCFYLFVFLEMYLVILGIKVRFYVKCR